MDIIVNKEEFINLHGLNKDGYTLFIDPDGEFVLDINTNEENDVTIRLLFQFDDQGTDIRIYTNGLDDSLRYELLAIFKDNNIEYEME